MDSPYLNWDESDDYDKDDKGYTKSEEIERCNSDVEIKEDKELTTKIKL